MIDKEGTCSKKGAFPGTGERSDRNGAAHVSQCFSCFFLLIKTKTSLRVFEKSPWMDPGGERLQTSFSAKKKRHRTSEWELP